MQNAQEYKWTFDKRWVTLGLHDENGKACSAYSGECDYGEV